MRKTKLLSLLALLLMTATGAWAQDGGALNGKFTINASGDKVYFAQGNLQATYNGSNWSWAFAEHQWDYIGNAAGNTKVTESSPYISENATVDLFGWVGASSTWTGVNKYGITSSGATKNTDGYGNVASESLKSDWGELIGDGWFTLSGDEWAYLLNTRSTASGVRFAKASVNNVPGIIVLPDDWSTSYYALKSANTASVGFDANVISSADWFSSLEAHDAVFLPIAGLRIGGSILNIGGQGFYWTSTSAADVNCACALTFHATAVEPKWSSGVSRGYGLSVRLVKDALKVTGVTLSQTEAALVVGETLALTPTVAPADAKDKSVTWTTSDGSVATVANGVVTAQGAGTATITVTTTDGAKTATCTVSVTPVTPIAATSAVGTKGFFTDANGQTRLGIVVMLGGEKYAIALSNETDLTGLSGTYTKKVGDFTYYNFADACAKFANNQTNGSYTASNVWRLPTAAEFQNLIALGGSWNGTGYTWTIGGNSLFLPAAGYNDANPVSGVGYYWSSTQAQFLYFNGGSIYMPYGGPTSGMPLRLFCQLPPIPSITFAEDDDNSTALSTADGNVYNVTLTRTLQAGGWNTFCTPFNAATPSGWTVKELSSSEFNSSTGELTLTFGNAASIEAGKPYLVKVTATVVNPVFDGVTVSNTTTTTEKTAVDFVPVMNPTSLTGGDKTVLFVTGGNKLTYPSGNGNINGFRAYFRLKGDAASARAFRMSFDDNVTGIVTVLSDEPTTANGTYTLDGRRIEGQPTQKGVYIVNGKKTIIK